MTQSPMGWIRPVSSAMPMNRLGETEAGQPGAPGNPYLVAGLGAIATQRMAGFHFAHGGDADIERAFRRVAADDIDAVFGRASKKAFGEFGNPGLVDRAPKEVPLGEGKCPG